MEIQTDIHTCLVDIRRRHHHYHQCYETASWQLQITENYDLPIVKDQLALSRNRVVLGRLTV